MLTQNNAFTLTCTPATGPKFRSGRAAVQAERSGLETPPCRLKGCTQDEQECEHYLAGVSKRVWLRINLLCTQINILIGVPKHRLLCARVLWQSRSILKFPVKNGRPCIWVCTYMGTGYAKTVNASWWMRACKHMSISVHVQKHTFKHVKKYWSSLRPSRMFSCSKRTSA